ncbi:MAG: acyl-ACP--UDP-N-acetylglucosamine O-acyltransferase [Candidatus Aminicenantes bacterium]|nr:MAG: acyl-ACP--UDP-N-acetylglucosamine O-acyltransferase [Candidatus Aminicenantes bacterium]
MKKNGELSRRSKYLQETGTGILSSNANVTIHPTAIVSEKARLGNQVEIGAYSIVGDDVVIGDHSIVMHHAVIDGYTSMGKNCKIFPFSSIGTEPQDVTFKGELTYVVMGDNNVIREFTTINRGTPKGGAYTRIGDNNYLMAYTHIAHDCRVGNYTQFVNGATLAGHVEVEDFAVIGAFSSVHQFVRIGRNAYIGGYTTVLQDILPYVKISQTRDAFIFYGPNSIGMMRNGISREFINNVKDIFQVLFKQDLNTTQAVEKIQQEYAGLEEANIIVDFISKTKRGFLKNFKAGRVNNRH